MKHIGKSLIVGISLLCGGIALLCYVLFTPPPTLGYYITAIVVLIVFGINTLAMGLGI